MSRIIRTVLVLGAGFGGLRAALLLAKKGQRVILIDQHEYHTYTPMLYEIAVTPKDMANYLNLKSLITFPLAEIAQHHHITFIHGHADAINETANIVRVGEREVAFEYLIVATGAEPNYFDIPGLREHAIPFKTFMDALKIRDAITSLPLGAKPRVVIGGGGPTGVELAGEIQLAGLANVTIVQRPPSILPDMHLRVIEKAVTRLDMIGVEIIYDIIRGVDDNHVILESNEAVPYDVLVWTGGMKPSSIAETIPLEYASQKIHIIGDAARGGLAPHLCETRHSDIPSHKSAGLAVIALDQARVAVNNILGKKTIYQPRPFPYIMPIGGKYAIFQWGLVIFDGFVAWLLKCFVELFYLIKIIGVVRALRIWLKSMHIYLHNDMIG